MQLCVFCALGALDFIYCSEHVHVVSSFLSDVVEVPSGSSNGLRHGLAGVLLKTMHAPCAKVGRSDNGASQRFERPAFVCVPRH